MKVDVKDLAGKVVETLELKSKVFDVDINENLLHQVYVARYANQRHSKAHTKTRGEIQGSTKKPWKQKGTGRARTGDVKNPIWRSGGTVFGPRNNRNYSQKINKKEARLATVMALVSKIKEDQLVVVKDYNLKEVKTGLMAKVVDKLKLAGKTLMVFDKDGKKYMRASQNLPQISNLDVEKLNVLDILNNKYIVVSEAGMKFLDKKYSK